MSLQCRFAQRGWGGDPGPSLGSQRHKRQLLLDGHDREVDAHLAAGAPLFREMSSGELGGRIKSPVKG